MQEAHGHGCGQQPHLARQMPQPMEGSHMAGRWKGSLALLTGLLATVGQAEEASLPAIAHSSSRPNAQAESAVSKKKPAPIVSLAPPVALGRPVPLDSGVMQATFLEPAVSGPVFRAQASDEPRPLPKTPSIWGETIGTLIPSIGTSSPKDLPNGAVIATSGLRVVSQGPAATVEGPPLSSPVVYGSNPADCCDSCGSCGFFHGWMSRLFCCGDGWSCAPQPENNCFYGKTEYLLWWMKGNKLPPLVTTGSANDTRPGAIGQPGTVVLFGGQAEDPSSFSGVRATLGFWLDECHNLALEGSFFTLFQKSTNFSAASPGTPVLARPFFNVLTGQEDAELVAFPGVLAGGVSVVETSRLFGADLNLRTNLCKGCCYNIDVLGGFRFIGLDNSLTIQENLLTLNNPGGGFIVQDRFSTQNRFYGGQFGFDSEVRWRRWFVDTKVMFALGSNHESANIGGNTVVTAPGGATSVFNGGLLALSTNSGQFSREMFVFAPEFTVNVGYQITDHIRGFVGYNVLYMSNVLRPGSLIDRSINTDLLPPPAPSLPARPAFTYRATDFWAQGVNFGLEFRY
jgi:hypothetical protein